MAAESLFRRLGLSVFNDGRGGRFVGILEMAVDMLIQEVIQVLTDASVGTIVLLLRRL